jgi:hypothetical protein
LGALIHYAWNLRDNQVYIYDELNDEILKRSLELSERFGQCDDLPIVYPQDFRKTFARLCVSYALIDLSTFDDFQTVTVTKKHVETVGNFIEAIYSSENCRLDAYSKMYSDEHHGFFDNPIFSNDIND